MLGAGRYWGPGPRSCRLGPIGAGVLGVLRVHPAVGSLMGLGCRRAVSRGGRAAVRTSAGLASPKSSGPVGARRERACGQPVSDAGTARVCCDEAWIRVDPRGSVRRVSEEVRGPRFPHVSRRKAEAGLSGSGPLLTEQLPLQHLLRVLAVELGVGPRDSCSYRW